MNKCTKSRLSGLCGLLTLTAAALCSPAESAAQMYIGYVNPQETVYPYTGFTNNSQEELTLYFMVRLEASKFDSFDGATLTGLRVGWSMGEDLKTPDMQVFVREELNGENLAEGTQQVTFGWNDIKFDTPYAISSGKDLYLGGKVAWEPGAWLGTGVFGYTLPENTQYMGNTADVDADGNINWIDATDNNMVLMLLGIVEAAGEEFNDQARLTDVRANDIQMSDSPADAWLTIKNEGLNELRNIEISSSLGDKKWSGTMEFNVPINAGAENDVTGGFQALGTGTHKIWISKVNGKDVDKPSVVEREVIAVPSDVASKYARRPLVERWVSESEYRTPSYTDDIFTPGVEEFAGRVSLIAHHFSDQFMIYHEFDAEVDNEDIQFLVDFANGEKSRVSVPSFAVDRSFIPQNPLARSYKHSVAYNFIYPDFIGPLYEAALAVPTFASVTPSVTVDGLNGEIRVSGNVEPGVMPRDESLFLTVYLVEDGIKSTSQEFPDETEVTDRYNGVFAHNDVIRLSLTDMYGDKLDGEGEYSKTYSFEMEPDWDKDHIRVLAFLNRSGERYGHMQVINSGEINLDGTGVDDIRGEGSRAFSVNGRDIVAAPGFGVEVYTLSGTRVAGLGLCPGIYIVKACGPDGASASKVAIN